MHAAAAPVSELTPPIGINWRGRAWLLLQLILVAAVCNSLALQLPGSTPFLVGNMAAVAITLRFGFAWGWPVALLSTAFTGSGYWVALGLLECVLVARYGAASRPLAGALLRIWLPLMPLVLWITLPLGAGDGWLWAIGAGIVLVNGAVSLLGGRLLASVSRSPRQAANRPMAALLASQLSILMAAPLTVLVMVMLQAGHQQDLRRTALVLDGKARALEAQVVGQLEQHRDAVALAAAFLPSTGVAPTLANTAKTYPGFLTLLLADSRGDVIAAFRDGEMAESDRSVADRDYFKRAIAQRQRVLTPVFRGRGLGSDIIVAVAAPVLGVGGTPVGVVQGALSIGRVAPEIRIELDAAGLDHAVIDDAGQVVFSSLPDYPPMSQGDAAGTLRDGGSAQPWWARELFPAPGIRFGANDTHLLARNRNVLLGWQAVVLQPLRPLERAQSLRSLLAAIGVLLVVLGLQRVSTHFANRHVRGLSALVERLRSFDPGEATLPHFERMVGSSAELTELIDDFTRAEERLRELHAALRRSAEAQQRLNHELEARVRQRTTELREALANAKLLAEAKSSFLANMSHELRTPLAAILGYSERALSAGTGPAETRAALGTILRNGRHLLEIVNDVLDASKIEAGQLRIDSAPQAPLPAIAEAMEMLRQRADEKGLALSLQPVFPLPAHVPVDALRLKQIVLNLVSNALKFTANGAVTVGVAADPAAGRWSVFVEDTGMGMDAASCAQLFQRFGQVDASTTRRFGGTGLGLYISRELARQMGGDLQVASRLGVGSRFTLELPFEPSTPMVDSAVAALSDTSLAVRAPPVLAGTVLVVDDVEDLRELVAGWVAATGASVRKAANGREACAAVREGGIDLVLMDMHMPVMDGREAVAALRAEGFALPMVALSADVMPAEVDAFLALGCSGALPKPIDLAALYDTLALYLPPGAVPEAPVADSLAIAMAAIRQRFLAAVDAECEALENARSAGDFDALRAQAHRLKGSAGTFGFDAVSAAAARANALLHAAAQSTYDLDAALDALAAELRATQG